MRNLPLDANAAPAAVLEPVIVGACELSNWIAERLDGLQTSDTPKSSSVSSLSAWRLARNLRGFSREAQRRILDVLQKANRLRLARLEAAAAIEKAKAEITYPLPEEQVNPPLDPRNPWHTEQSVCASGLFPDLGQRELDLNPRPRPSLRLVDRPPR